MLIPADRHAEERMIEERVAAQGSISQHETRYLTHDGREIDVSVTVSPLRDGQGSVVGASLIARDISERKAFERTMRDWNNELERRVGERTAALNAALKELESFSYTVSHDLKTPLNGIGGLAQLVLLKDYAGRPDSEGGRYLKRIRDEVMHMAAFIDSLMNLARSSRVELQRTDFDLSTLAREVVAELRSAQPQRAIELVIGDSVWVNGDREQLRAVLANLLGNAWKYTQKVAQPRVEFGALLADGPAGFFVRDNGAGFDMTQAARLFEAFERLHAAADFPGHGVGLAIVKRIIERHNGRVWAESAPGQGATFYCTLGWA
jgi:hypothetical protein